MPRVEQELLTIPEHLNLPWVFRVSVAPALVFSVVLCLLCLSFVFFVVDHDLVCLPT